MKNIYLLAALAVLAATLFTVGISSAHSNNSGAQSMMGSGMHGAGMMQGHMTGEDAESMVQHMKEHHAGMTDEEISEMIESCPMMRGS